MLSEFREFSKQTGIMLGDRLLLEDKPHVVVAFGILLLDTMTMSYAVGVTPEECVDAAVRQIAYYSPDKLKAPGATLKPVWGDYEPVAESAG